MAKRLTRRLGCRGWSGGTVAELGFGEELEDGHRHDVRGRVADHTQSGGIVLLEQLKRNVFGERCGEIDNSLGMRGRAGVHGLFGGFESGFIGRVATDANGLMRATTTAAARRGEMLLAMSSGVVPLETSRMEPSGSWTLIWLLTGQG